MAVFTPPLRTDWTFAEGADLTPSDKRYWAHFGTQPRGRSVIKIAGVWTTKDNPTTTEINDATRIITPGGDSVPGAFVGGHIYQITAVVQAELVAAGYGANIT